MKANLKSKDIQENKVPSIVRPIGKHPLTGYPEVMCPSCKRHFYWRQIDKKMYCICGEVVSVDESQHRP